MRTNLAQWSLILLCFSMAGALGGGLYEHIVLTPLWSASPPSSFAIIQRGLFFIREMLAFQKIPLDSAPSAELSARVARWTYWTWFREPLDIVSFLCCLLALYWLNRS